MAAKKEIDSPHKVTYVEVVLATSFSTIEVKRSAIQKNKSVSVKVRRRSADEAQGYSSAPDYIQLRLYHKKSYQTLWMEG